MMVSNVTAKGLTNEEIIAKKQLKVFRKIVKKS
jgi:hypothetical protein